MTLTADTARIALGCVRLTMGTAGLLAPDLVLRRLQADPAEQRAARHPLRMFGIRTVLIGVDLLRSDGPERRHAQLVAPVIHGSDTASAVLALRRGELPRRGAAVAAAISAVNLVLSLAALRPPAGRTSTSGSAPTAGARGSSR